VVLLEAMPFRIKVSLSILLAFIALLVIGPFLLPVSPLKDTQPEADLADSDSLFMNQDGIDIHYRDTDLHEAGGPELEDPLVLLHGYLFNTDSFRDLQPALARNGRVLSFDRPGFGLTERPERTSLVGGHNPYSPEGHVEVTRAFLDGLDIGEAVVFGHSSGAVTALELALTHPDRVSALILAAPAVSGAGSGPGWLQPVLKSPQMNRVGPLLMRQLAGDPGGGFLSANWGDPERIDDAAAEAFHRNFTVDGWDRGLWEISRASHDVTFLDRLGEITQPVLVLSGALDTIVPSEDSRELAGRLPDATYALLDSCGHAIHEECPDETAELVADWLADENLLIPAGEAR